MRPRFYEVGGTINFKSRQTARRVDEAAAQERGKKGSKVGDGGEREKTRADGMHMYVYANAWSWSQVRVSGGTTVGTAVQVRSGGHSLL